jgi:inorganic pyrophosphatase
MPSTKAVFTQLPAFDAKTRQVNMIVDTPKGSRNKYKFDPELGLFTLSKVLAVGHTFPYDFGYIPSTKGEDGDLLDVLILMDEAAFPGCHIPGRLIGVIRAVQIEDGQTARNDRLVAVAAHSLDHRDVQSLDDLNDHLIEEIEHFFISYNEVIGKTFHPEARLGKAQARKLVKHAASSQEDKRAKKGSKQHESKR